MTELDPVLVQQHLDYWWFCAVMSMVFSGLVFVTGCVVLWCNPRDTNDEWVSFVRSVAACLVGGAVLFCFMQSTHVYKITCCPELYVKDTMKQP